MYTNLNPVPDTLWFITIEDRNKGKITQLHNQTGQALLLNEVMQHGNWLPWYVDSMKVAATQLPYNVLPADSFGIRVRMDIPLTMNPNILFVADSMRVTTAAGSFEVIIMINRDLLQSVQNPAEGNIAGESYPNPFTGTTTIPFLIRQRGEVTLEILDIRGTRVRTLRSEFMEPGPGQAAWNGSDDSGNALPGGVYLIRFTSDNRSEIKRVVLIK